MRNSCRCRGDKRLPVRIIIARRFLSVGLLWVLIFAPAAYSQPSKAAGSAEWDILVDAAKKEGKVTVSIPASAEMRKQVEDQFKKRYGVEVEVFTGRGSAAVRRMADEFKAGVRRIRRRHGDGADRCASSGSTRSAARRGDGRSFTFRTPNLYAGQSPQR